MNVVDSCGWLEYIADGPNATFFEPVLQDLSHLIVPSITIYEVCKRILLQRGPIFAERALAVMKRGRVVDLDADGLYLASQASLTHQLAMADAIIWQTAQSNQALLWTQNADLKDAPQVRYQAKLAA